ncbi:MAG: hypothetical protein EP338_06130 [Bacteroidetes bacterium]|nr:MAG: hypothetical protein EP338_06130 [Bacteroidota bacterium]
MDHQRTIDTVGRVLTILSSLLLIGNLIGGLTFYLASSGSEASKAEDPMNFLADYYLAFCAVMILISLAYLLSAMALRKGKAWAYKTVRTLTMIFILLIYLFAVAMGASIVMTGGGYGPVLVIAFVALFISTPLWLLLWYLSKRAVRKLFV